MSRDHLLTPEASRELLRQVDLDQVKVKLVGRHPYRGRRGVVVRVEATALGLFPVVELDDGTRCMVTHKNQFVRL